MTVDSTSARPGDSDRRVYPRFPVEIEVTLHSDHNFFMGFTENLSEGGLFVATAMIKDVGTTISLSFTVPGGEAAIEAICLVQWVRPYHENLEAPAGMGVRFTDLDDKDATVIRSFLSTRTPIFYDD